MLLITYCCAVLLGGLSSDFLGYTERQISRNWLFVMTKNKQKKIQTFCIIYRLKMPDIFSLLLVSKNKNTALSTVFSVMGVPTFCQCATQDYTVDGIHCLTEFTILLGCVFKSL